MQLSTLFTILFILITSLSSGYGLMLWLLAHDADFQSDQLEIWVLIGGMGLLFNSWFIFTLTEIGLYSPWTMGCVSAVLGLFGAWRSMRGLTIQRFVWRDSTHWAISDGLYLPVWIETLILCGWLIVASVLFLRPHQHIWGAADVGVYINYASHIAQTGELSLQEPLIQDIPQELLPHFLGAQNPNSEWDFITPALDLNDASGHLFFSFYHLHPIWQAVGWSIGGLFGGLILTPLWGLFATLAFYFLLRHLLPARAWLWAFIGLVAMTVNPLQLWFVRYGTTEALTQLLFTLGFIAFCRWQSTKYESWVLGLMAGLAFGMTFLVRIDTFFIGIIPAVMLILILLGKLSWKQFFIFLVPLLLIAAQGSIHGAVFSPEYFTRLGGRIVGAITRLGPWLIIVGLVGGIIGAGSIRFFKGWVERILPPLRWLIVIAILGYGLYSWFIRPYSADALSFLLNGVPAQTLDHENLIRLGWYIMPFGVWLSIAGMVFVFQKRNWQHWYVTLPGLMYWFFYTWNLLSNGQLIYVMRRYVPIVLPFIIIVSVLLLAYFAGRKSAILRLASWVLMLVWIGGLINGSLGTITHVDYAGMHVQLEEAAAGLEPNSIVLFNQQTPVGQGDFIALPLRLMHGHSTFVLRNLTNPETVEMLRGTIINWQNEGRTVYIIDLYTQNESFIKEKFEINATYPISLEGTVLPSTYTEKPNMISNFVWQLSIEEIK
ncbi:MAG: hypothetical protein AAGD96_09790 [Chloroflexota bacterium]